MQKDQYLIYKAIVEMKKDILKELILVLMNGEHKRLIQASKEFWNAVVNVPDYRLIKKKFRFKQVVVSIF